MRFFPKSFKDIPRSAIILPVVTFAVIAAIILAGDIIPVKEWLKLPGKYFGQKTSKLATLKERISRINGVVQEGQTLYSIMEGFQLSSDTIRLIVAAAKPHVDLNRLRVGDEYWVVTGEHGELRGFEYYPDPEHLLKVFEKDGRYTAELEQLPVSIKLAVRSGTVVSSLHESFVAAGADTGLVIGFADIFAWEVDFSSDLRPGAEWRILYEEKWHDGKAQGVGRIIAAEIVNAGKGLMAAWFETAPGKGEYFMPDGHSTRRMFLKSPIPYRYGAVSRPVRASRGSNGVEYDALPGTPVVATADGLVSSLGSIKGRGRTLTLRHGGGFVTQYTHLGGFAEGVGKGGRVRQGTVVGYVGATGKKGRTYLAFLVEKGGKAVDPLKLPDLSATRIAAQDMPGFTSYMREKSGLLRQPPVLSASSVPEGAGGEAVAPSER